MSNNFAGLDGEYSEYNKSKIVIIPVPFVQKSQYNLGNPNGPKEIIDASKLLELYDIDTDSLVYEKGIHTLSGIKEKDAKEMILSVEKKVSGSLKESKFPVVIGGEHSVSIGSIKAHSKAKEITIIQLDAHTDMRDDLEGNRYSFGCAMKRVADFNKDIIHVGIRSMDSSEIDIIDKKKLFFAKDIINKQDWIKEIIKRSKDSVYITIDLDVFDPSIMPSVATPEPGGLGWYDVIMFINKLSEKKQIVGFDVVELSPIKGLLAPNFLASKLIYTILSQIFKNQ